MGRLVKPNWGRSAPCVRAAASGMPDVELVRVELSKSGGELPPSADFTLYLGTATDDAIRQPGADTIQANPVTISWGSGGTMRQEQIAQTVRGRVLHFVADSIIVTQSPRVTTAVADDVLNTLRISAIAALGRPTRVARRAELANGTQNLAPGETTFVRLSAWASEVQINASGAAADLELATVRQIFRDTAAAISHANIAQPVSSYNGVVRGLGEYANALEFVNGGAATVIIDFTEYLLL